MSTHQILLSKGYKLERSGGVWQYRKRDSFYNLGLNNAYKENDVVSFINTNYKYEDEKLIPCYNGLV